MGDSSRLWEFATGEGLAIAAASRDGDAERLRDEFRAVGVEKSFVRLIVFQRIWKNLEVELRALNPVRDLAFSPWWKKP